MWVKKLLDLSLWCFRIVAFSCLLITAAYAGTGQWTSTGPEDGIISSLAINPENPLKVYAGTYSSGIFKSSDGGDSWYTDPVSPSNIIAIIVDPATTSTLYAATSNTIYMSTDDGASWAQLGSKLLSGSISQLVMTGGSSRKLFAAGYNGIYEVALNGSGIIQINTGIPVSYNFSSLRSTSSGALYVLNNGKVYRRMPADVGWSLATTGIDAAAAIKWIAVEPSHETTLYAVTAEGIAYRSTDAGANWSLLATRWPYEGVKDIAVSPVSPSRIYCFTWSGGVYQSIDQGASWSSLRNSGLPYADYFTEALAPTGVEKLYVGGNGSLFRSLDGGLNWSMIVDGFNAAAVYALGVVNSSTPAVLAGGGGGTAISRSTDAATTWVPSSVGLPEFISVYAMAVNPDNPLIVYAGYNTATGIARSNDGGQTWQQLFNGLPSEYGYVASIAIAPSNPSIIYITGGLNRPLYRTDNGGASWSTLSATGIPINTYIKGIAVSHDTSETLYAYSYDRIFKSLDGGGNWSEVVVTGLPTDVSIEALYLDGSTDDLYAIASKWNFDGSGIYGYYLSRYRSGSWQILVEKSSKASSKAMLFDPEVPGRIYIAVDNEVYYSTDPENNWNKLEYPGLNYKVNSLGIQVVTQRTLYAATEGGGVYALVEPVPLPPPPSNYQLTVAVAGTGSGTVTSVSAGFTCESGSCAAELATGSAISLIATPGSISTFGGWSGDCTNSSGDCSLTMLANKTVTASFNLAPKVKISRTGMGYSTVQEAQTSAQAGDTLLLLEDILSSSLVVTKNLQLKGGYNSSFSSQLGYTTLQGSLSITSGSAVVDRLVIK